MTMRAPQVEPKMPAEFDAYAPNYDAGMDNSLKALLGESADQFVALKLRWLLRRYPALRVATHAPRRILDYGCGAATLLRLMAEAGVEGSLTGCDISDGMLAEAERRWPERLRAAKPELRMQRGAATPFPDATFDLVVISAVLHHVPPAERPGVYAELCRIAKPGGQLVVFEHNPLNPVTRWVVARTPIDRDAVLLRATEAERGLATAGAQDVRTRYLMFAPPRLRAGAPLERMLGWFPLGAQYAVTGTVAPH